MTTKCCLSYCVLQNFVAPAIYSYTGEDWNVQDGSARKALESAIGQFTIYKSCLIEPEVHCKVRKHPMAGRNSLKRRLLAILTFRG